MGCARGLQGVAAIVSLLVLPDVGAAQQAAWRQPAAQVGLGRLVEQVSQDSPIVMSDANLQEASLTAPPPSRAAGTAAPAREERAALPSSGPARYGNSYAEDTSQRIQTYGISPQTPRSVASLGTWSSGQDSSDLVSNQNSDIASSKPDSPLAIYMHSLRSWLHSAPNQAVVGLLAIVVGMVCLWDGPALWQMLFTAAAAIAGAFVAHHEGNALGLTPNIYVEVLLVVEVGAVIGWATHRGFEGSQIVLGACLGSFGAYGIGAWARAMDATLPGVAVLWYSAGGGLGLLIYTAWRQAVLATFAPVLGGLFVSSGIGLLLSRSPALLAKAHQGDPLPLAWLPPSNSSWISVLEGLVGNGGGGVTLAALCGCTLLGAVVQSIQGSRISAVLLIVGGIVFSTLGASSCQYLHGYAKVECPAWLTTAADWHWLVVGGTLWALITAVSAYHQLGKHRGAETGTAYVTLAQPSKRHMSGPKDGGKMFIVEPMDHAENGNFITRWTGSE